MIFSYKVVLVKSNSGVSMNMSRITMTNFLDKTIDEEGFQNLNQYKLMNELGKGAFGIVKKARSTKDKQFYVSFFLLFCSLKFSIGILKFFVFLKFSIGIFDFFLFLIFSIRIFEKFLKRGKFIVF